MKTNKQLGLTKSQYKNIAKLTIFVRDSVPPPKFNILSFNEDEGSGINEPINAKYECGTSACFCGYGPLAGIKPKKTEDWWDYSARVFGASYDWSGGDKNTFRLLFDDEHKNSKDAAIKRGAYFLMNGFPETDNLSKWETPRSFKIDWPAIEKIANS